MTSLPLPSTISQAEFQAVLSRYSTVLKVVSDRKQPAKKSKGSDSQTLEEIDGWRDGLPDATKFKKSAKGEFGGRTLDASQAKNIVLWKLKRGKFRPTILPLVSSNPVKELEAIINEALSMPLPGQVTLDGTGDDDNIALAQVSSMMKVLVKLKGIGPATATAILSSVFPEIVPMFSDEAFRWIMMNESGNSTGWNRKIAYDAKEYSEFFRRVRQLCRKLTSEGEVVSAGNVEKVGWVLGQEAALGITHSIKKTPTKSSRRIEFKKDPEGAPQQEQKRDNALSSNSELSKSVTDGLETTGSLSKTRAKRKNTSAEISPPPLRRSKRNKEA